MNFLGVVIGKPTKTEVREKAVKVADIKLAALEKLEEQRNAMRAELTRALKQIVEDLTNNERQSH